MDIRFHNQIGRELAGRLERPLGVAGTVPAIVFAHGFDSGKDSPRGITVAKEIRAAGMATFLIDLTGHGDSGGTKDESTIERQSADLQAAIDFLELTDDIDISRIGLCGASSGGLAALTAALCDDRVAAVALRGPRTDGMIDLAGSLTMPIFIVQGSHDPLLGEAQAFWRALPGPKAFDVISGADHLFSGPGQIEEAAALTARWLADTFLISGRKAA